MGVCDVILKTSAERAHLSIDAFNKRLIHLSLVAVHWFAYEKQEGCRETSIEVLISQSHRIDFKSGNQPELTKIVLESYQQLRIATRIEPLSR